MQGGGRKAAMKLNRELRTEVNEKRFRADLFYRVNVLEVVMPPLRQRSDDLPLLVDALLSRIGGSARAQEELRSDAFLTQLRGHSWPGNVRELRNHLERCLALREVLAPEHIVADHEAHDDIDTTVPLKEARERWSRRLEKQYVTAVLQRADGNVTAAARAAGVDRMYLYRLLWRHGLREHGS